MSPYCICGDPIEKHVILTPDMHGSCKGSRGIQGCLCHQYRPVNPPEDGD